MAVPGEGAVGAVASGLDGERAADRGGAVVGDDEGGAGDVRGGTGDCEGRDVKAVHGLARDVGVYFLVVLAGA